MSLTKAALNLNWTVLNFTAQITSLPIVVTTEGTVKLSGKSLKLIRYIINVNTTIKFLFSVFTTYGATWQRWASGRAVKSTYITTYSSTYSTYSTTLVALHLIIITSTYLIYRIYSITIRGFYFKKHIFCCGYNWGWTLSPEVADFSGSKGSP